ncbi:MAG: tripartite tricarboxylate transporter substrate binding protein [Deltaproteobacteria bacterium]|nr:tripartite tricarboxylate transporter substrate binding protein [Deltaproteobacteria bacterium]MBW1942219.1 tripartite tricarboxylate transporter substrate binding protein [Deltaproteobacteria bacterium]MBW2206969.1 tripartite tricarboxylate transporter substrate binding protein [Deltaproteobacteria bacterium]
MGERVRKYVVIVAVLSAICFAAGAVGGLAVAADKFPNGPVQLVVPFKPGGGADRTMRLFAPYLSKELGVPVNVINISGGGGWVAWSQVAKWDPKKDDHKLACVNIPHVLSYMDPRMKRKETLESFGFLAWHSFDPCIWAVREGDPRFQTLKEFLAYVKANPNKVIMSTTGVGSDDHMGIAYAEKYIPDFKVKKVYANSDGKKIAEVLGKHTDAVAGNVGYYIPYMLEMKLRPIAVLHHERWNRLPSVRTFNEVTGKMNISYAGRTLAGAKGLPEEKRQIYIAAIGRAIKNPEYVMKEINNKNALLYLTGDDLWDALNRARQMVSEVKFWEMATK